MRTPARASTPTTSRSSATARACSITNNWIHHQGYFNGAVTGNAGSTYIHGGSNGSVLYENNLIQTARGRTEICGLGTGGTSRSNLTIRNNTWIDGGRPSPASPASPGTALGLGQHDRRNIAVDPDGGFALIGSSCRRDHRQQPLRQPLARHPGRPGQLHVGQLQPQRCGADRLPQALGRQLVKRRAEKRPTERRTSRPCVDGDRKSTGRANPYRRPQRAARSGRDHPAVGPVETW